MQQKKIKFSNLLARQMRRVHFIQKKLSEKSYPQISDVKNVIQKSYPIFFQINGTLYHTNDAVPLYIKEKKVFHSILTPLFYTYD